jgi:PPM family protein phosphatase
MNVSKAIRVARISHVGMLREHNEDAVASDMSIGLVLLADGMGGYKAGEVASQVAVLLIATEMTEAMHGQSMQSKTEPHLLLESNMLINAVEKANKAIYEIAQLRPECAGMGTTLVVGVFTDNRLVLGHIGDSRMYRLRGGVLDQLTEDHSLVQEQINAGLITVEQAKVSKNKNLVTRALGIDPVVELELQELGVELGDKYLLCSDGLSDLLSDAEITQILLDEKDNIESAVDKLVERANQLGGSDNISVVITAIEKSFGADKSWVRKMLRVRN